jgi:hypothetical protein
MTDPTPADDARRWLLENHVGTLCSTMARRGMQGFPYGSVVPFALTPEGRPFILIAGIATHTANLRQEPRASLFVRQSGLEGDPQKGWRITVMGEWEEVDREAPEVSDLHARYVERVPWADGYLSMHDFSYWRMKAIQAVRYIGGFGRIHWIDGAEVERDPMGEGIAAAAPGAVAHMNEDHGHNLLEMVKGRYGVEPGRAEMRHLTRDGFMVETHAPDGRYWFPFGREISAATLRTDVIDVLRACRQRSAS